MAVFAQDYLGNEVPMLRRQVVGLERAKAEQPERWNAKRESALDELRRKVAGQKGEGE